MAELVELKKKRTALKGKATRFRNFIDAYIPSEEDIFELESRMEKVELLWSEYDLIQNEIDALLPAEETSEREQFENAFFQAQNIAKRKRARYYENKRSNVSGSESAMTGYSNGGGSSLARLPIITLPNFDGSYERWQGFYDTFLAMVDRNTTLDTITKFHYLQSALTGGAREYVNSFEVMQENYSIVLELLKKRYHNLRLIVNHHVKQLFNLPMITRDSAVSLRALADGLQKHTRILEQLREPVDKWDTLLLYLAPSRLDNVTKREWELKVVSEKLSKLSQFIEFLETRCQMLEAIAPQETKSGANGKMGLFQGIKRENRTLAHLATGDPLVACAICNQNHRVYACSGFLGLSVDERRNKVKEFDLCFNCLGTKHTARECKSTRFCKHCNSLHHSLLHQGNRTVVRTSNAYHNGRKDEKQNNNAESSAMSSVSVNMFACKNTNEKILSTVVIYVKGNLGQLVKARALLDNGSMANFMTREFCNKLRLKEKQVSHTVSGINLTETNVMSCATATILSTQNNYKIKAEFFVTNNISHCIPVRKINVASLSIPEHVHLADPEFHNPQPIDLLLGTSIFWDSMESDQIRPGHGHPVLHLTKFGWILGGFLTVPEANRKEKSTVLFCGISTDGTLDNHMEKFWAINEGPETRLRSAEETNCEQNFSETHKRAADGRFEVSLPMKKDSNMLGDSRSNAEKRLLAVERRFKKDQGLKERYCEFLNEYIKLGHMTQVADQAAEVRNYLPHHAVLKEASTTTKLRVVWDASCKTTSGVSLNDCVMTGPVVQQELFEIIIRFRQHRFVVTGDIVKMYRQIWVTSGQRNLQCILWREDPSQPMVTYRLNTVTFGVTSSPYLATRCLVQLAEECKELYPLASRVIREDFYVDDMLSGGGTRDEVNKISEEVKTVLKSAGFELQKIYTNDNDHEDEGRNHDITEIKTLGLRWQPRNDCLRYHSSYESAAGTVTKRSILSVIAQVFDPLGLIGPFVVRSKLLLQYLWKLKIGWDAPIPSEVSAKWTSICDQLRRIEGINIPRHSLLEAPQEIQIHGFCDASEAAYGACIYLRSTNASGVVLVRLLAARSRVAPVRTVSLPRLELCGAVLLANLYAKVRGGLTVEISESWFWSDSMVALAWIKGDASRWHTFVGNRVSEIQQITSAERWNHVRTDQNPADLISRGRSMEELQESTLWWNGPNYLLEQMEEWPHEDIKVTEVPDEKKVTLTFALMEKDFSTFRRFSSWNKLCRVITYCRRFVANLVRKKKGVPLILECLSVDEIQGATITLLRLHQEEEFVREMNDLRQDRKIDSTSRLLSFNPFLDDDGLIRVGGRLANAPISYSQRFPIILSTKHILTELIIRDCHYKNLHAGSRLLKGILRETYWVLSAESAIRRVLRKCLLCFRLRPRIKSQLMGNLPAERVTASRVFAHTGLDYVGPFKIKISRNVTGKAYLCLFVCMAVKAVHLELVSDLSTNSFLNALKRFIARRGKCLTLHSDNGTNFVGAENELRKIVSSLLTGSESKAKLAKFVTDNSIEWKFIPPGSPHMGGLWEAAVKSQ